MSTTSFLSADQIEYLLDEYLTRSHKYKGSQKRWDCPCCGGANVDIRNYGIKDGAVQCWECGVKLKEILTAAGGWQEYLELAFPDQYKDGKRIGAATGERSVFYSKPKKKTSKKKVRVYPDMDIPKALRLMQLSSASFCQVQDEYHQRSGMLVKTHTFEFSPTQMIKRFNLADGGKEFKFLHKVSDRWCAGKGEAEFPVYRMDEVFGIARSKPRNRPNAILMTEGELCADYVRFHLKRACVSVDGSAWNAKAIQRLAIQLKALNLSLVYLADNDNPGHKKAALVKEECRAVGVYCLVIYPSKSRWKEKLGVGDDIADLIKLIINGGQMPNESYEDFLKRIQAEQDALADELEDEVECQHKEELEELFRLQAGNPLPGQEHPEVKPAPQWLAEKMVNQLFSILRWVPGEGRGAWWMYLKEQGIWKKGREEDVAALAIEAWKKDASATPMKLHDLNSILAFLKVGLKGDAVVHPRHLIPFRNGVLNKHSGVFGKHSPRNQILWTLPYNYQEPQGSRLDLMKACGPIIPWMHSATGSSPGDLELVNLLLCYLAAVMRGMTHLQKYLECIGPPGSGKGTFLRLAQAVMGGRNTFSTSLSRLESRFESATVSQAPLVLITDAEHYTASALTLQSLTGQDVMPGEKKGVQQEVGEGQAAAGMVILAGESIPKTSGSTGINRRRITVPFPRKVSESERKNLLTIEKTENGDLLSGLFAPYIPALVNLILSYSTEEITDYVGKTSITVKALAKSKAENLIAGNPLAAWADEHLIWDDAIDAKGLPELSAKVGRLTKDDAWQEIVWTQLYANYSSWCEFNKCKAVAGNKFSADLLELFNNQLGLPILHRRERDGARIYGIKLRDPEAIYTDDDTKEGLLCERPITTTYVKKEMGERRLRGATSQEPDSCDRLSQNVTGRDEGVTRETPDFWDTLHTLHTFESQSEKKEIDNCHIAGTHGEENSEKDSDQGQSISSSSLPGIPAVTSPSQPVASPSQDVTLPTQSDSADLQSDQDTALQAAQFLSSISNGVLIQDCDNGDESGDGVLRGKVLPTDDSPPEEWHNCEDLDE